MSISSLTWVTALDSIDWEELAHLYEIAPLGHKTPAALKTSFSNSMFRYLVYDGPVLVAAGRALADGADCSYLCDVAVHPEYQGFGLGKEIVSRLVHDSRDHRKIILYAAPGKDSFYLKLGFRRMTTAMAIFRNESNALEMGLIQ